MTVARPRCVARSHRLDPDIGRGGLVTIAMLIVELTLFAVGFYTANQFVVAAFATACCFWCYCCGVLAVHRRAQRAYEALTYAQRLALDLGVDTSASVGTSQHDRMVP
jgi:fucose 4-O-acetylase-like acetyltransferase